MIFCDQNEIYHNSTTPKYEIKANDSAFSLETESWTSLFGQCPSFELRPADCQTFLFRISTQASDFQHKLICAIESTNSYMVFYKKILYRKHR